MIASSRRGFIAGLASLLAAGPAVARAVSAAIKAPKPTPIFWTASSPGTSLFVDGDIFYNGVIIREGSLLPQAMITRMNNKYLCLTSKIRMPESENGYLPPGDEEEEALDDPDEWRDYSDE